MPATRYHTRERAVQEATFLRALSFGKTVQEAADLAGAHRRTFYRRRRTNAEFAARWTSVLEQFETEDISRDALELEAKRRAILGTEKPVFRGGAIVGHTVDYSDSMLMFLLKAKYPEKYDRSKSDRAKSDASDAGGSLDIAGARDALLSKFAQAAQ